MIELTTSGQIAQVELRGDEGNRIGPDDLGRLQEAFRAAHDASGVVAIVLAARGDDFCAGRVPPRASTMSRREAAWEQILATYEAVGGGPAPVVAAVHGRAWGFGLCLAMAADIVVVDADADLRLPELEQGIPPTLALSSLTTKVPRPVLAWLALTGTAMSGRAALERGVVAEVATDVRARATQIARGLADRDGSAVATVRRFVEDAHARPERRRALAVEMMRAHVVSRSPGGAR